MRSASWAHCSSAGNVGGASSLVLPTQLAPCSMNHTEYLIIGAGPTGLGAATRLMEKGLDYHVLEAESRFGGLAASNVDEQGFTWDQGGHVQFSHYETFDRYMELALGVEGWLTHQRESWVWICKDWVPYPFQNNLHRLPPPERWECVRGLLRAWQETSQIENRKSQIENFHDWILQTFGEGIARLFMSPYNFKVWATDPRNMDYHWIGERVSVPELENVLRSICTGEDQVSWGPNATFRFPKRGGTGAVWQAIGRMLPTERVSLNERVAAINAQKKQVEVEGGDCWRYHYLISTMPLNHLIRLCPGVIDASVADQFVYCATHIVGIGLNGAPPPHLQTKCWMYFPESNSPYYRVTVFSNYSPNNVARPGEQWSLMAETSESKEKPVDAEHLVEQTIQALFDDGLIPDQTQICSTVHCRLPQGYPVPFKGRDNVLVPVLKGFDAVDVYSRGRFGAWKYEVANQDHSFAQGYECAERLMAEGGPEYEPTLYTPDVVNARKNP